MNDDVLIKKLSKILEKYNGGDVIVKEDFFKDSEINLDSINLTNFILELENEFKIPIEEDNLHVFNNLKLIYNFLKKKLNQ